MNAIGIFWLRELKRYFRSKARLIGSLGQPLFFLFSLGLGLNPVFQRAGEGNYFQFLAPGIIAMTILFTAIFSGIQVIWDRQFGFLKVSLAAPVSRLTIVIGKSLGGATIATFQGLIVLLLASIAGFRPDMTMFPLTLVFMSVTAFVFTALGITIASLIEDMQGFQVIMNFIVQPLFFLSGALFPLTNLPKFFTHVVAANPLSYGVDGIRATLVGGAYYGIATDLTVLVVLSVVIMSIGSYLFSKIQA